MNLPNKLTMARIIMVPIFMATMLAGHFYWASTVFVLASLTDFLDGYLARKYNLVSSFGKIMDPLADKILAFGALVCFIQLEVVAVWAPIIIIAREFFVTSMRVVAVSKGKVIAASWWGKVKTNVQLFAIIFAMLLCGMEKQEIAGALIWIAALFTVASWVAYVFENISVFRDEK
ncbi:MAG: CDP-diacylglycerol--glycerol-3-phosphate 3-phosphatidyltransferase [Clostridia bacterium]|nr:CDP-diacylglycerol--glycerol-3-phosphate 3-phosphatidyltransferase [Clostridia bacterium]